MTTFQPFISYAGYEHILGATSCFIHPGNGTPYFAACEKQSGAHQNLSIYRWRGGTIELVKRYYGTVDSEAQITMGGAVITPDGAMWVATSLIIPGAERVTTTGFQGVYLREPDIDEPYVNTEELESRITALEARIRALEWYFAIPGTLRLPAQEAPTRGGEIMLADGKGGNWSIDVTNGELRVFLNGAGGRVALKLMG